MSVKIKVYNQKAEAVSELALNDKVFGVAPNNDLLHQAMVAQMSNERQVLAHTKDRSEVRGGGKKPWKQKGTGRARAGSSRSPIWVGGGVVFGPRNDRNFSVKINQKMKQKALTIVLSDKAANGHLLVIDSLEMPERKTKNFDAFVKAFETAKVMPLEKKRSLMVINGAKDENVKLSGRNLPGVEIINLENLNILDLLKFKYLFLTSEVAKALEERYQ
jgi:large subunit ribosomal protein L4